MTMNRSLSQPILNTSTALIAQNPVLEYGQLAQETDTNRCKSGDGTSTYTQLTYAEWAYEIVEAAGTDTYTGTFSSPIFLAYFPMMRIRVRFTNANTGAATINLNSLGAKDIKKSVSTALAAGDIMAGGIYELYYDGTNFQIPAAVGGSAGALGIEQVLINGSDAGDEGIENLGNIVNTFGTRTLTIFQDSGNVQFWQPYLRDSSNGDVASVLIDISTPNAPYAELITSDGTKVTQLRASIDQVDIYGSPGTFRGAVYSADYSANYTARSLIDQGYAAATFAPISVTNALTATHVGFGSGANVLTGSANLVWTGTQLTVNGTVSSTGYQISGAAATGTILRGNGSSFVASTNTYPDTTPVNQILFATSANVIGGSTTALISGTTLIIGATAAVSGEQFSFQGSTNAGVFIRVKNATSGTAAATSITLTDAANLSIAFSSYSALFTSSGMSEAATGALVSNQTNGLNIGTTSNTQTSFWTNNTKRATFLSTGELAVGGTTTISSLYKIHSMASAGFAGNMISSWSTTDTHYGILAFLKSASATIGTGAATAASEDLGQIQWNGYNSGNTGATPASIRVIQSGAAGATFIGADMIFLTGTNAAARTQSLKITAEKSLVVGNAALATTATDGFLYIPTCAGTPTGAPTAQTGTVAMVFDTTNNKLYIYDGGWIGGTTPGAFT